jgi:acyl-CoA thioesterase-1
MPSKSTLNPLGFFFSLAASWAMAGLSLAAEAGDKGGREDSGTVLFLGNSLTAGYGLDPDLAFPSLLRERIEATGLPFTTINAGVSGDTSAGGLRRVNWILRRPVDVLVLSLGANDGLRGFNLEATRTNLRQIVSKVHASCPDAIIILAGMKVPPNMGPEYSREFERIYTDLAKEARLTLIPFLLEGVAAEPKLNQADGIHPNAAGHRIVADTVWEYLYPVLKARTASR